MVVVSASILEDGSVCLYPIHPMKTEDADLSNAEYVNVNLEGTVFSDVNLQRVRIMNASLAGGHFEDVNLSKVVIQNANLSNLSIRDACYDGMRIEGILVSELLEIYREKYPR